MYLGGDTILHTQPGPTTFCVVVYIKCTDYNFPSKATCRLHMATFPGKGGGLIRGDLFKLKASPINTTQRKW